MIGQRLIAGFVLASVFSLGALAGIFYDRHPQTKRHFTKGSLISSRC